MIVPFNYLNYQFKDKKKYFAQWSKLIDTSEFTWVRSLKNLKKNFQNMLA